MTNKTFNFDFFTIRTANNSTFDFSVVLDHIASGNPAAQWSDRHNYFKIKGVRKINHVFYGEFCKYRMDNIPHAGSLTDEAEREIQLRESEGLIEKNHFSYVVADKVVVFQRNGSASRGQKMGAYFSELNNETITLDPIVTGDSLSRLMNNEAKPIELELSVARPTNPDLFPSGNTLTDQMASWMNSAGGSRLKIKMSRDARANETDRRHLKNKVKELVSSFFGYEGASVLKVKVEHEDGSFEPIDLIADRIFVSKVIRMNGRYPNQQSMVSALTEAFSDKQDEIYEVIGTRESRL